MQVKLKARKNLKDSVGTLSSQIGNTPLVRMNQVFTNPDVKIYAKLEWKQLGGSVKARAAYHIIKDAIEKGELGRGKRLVDATSGNTGIAYATICQKLEIPLTIVIPENASKERIHLLKSLGAELILSSRMESTDGAQELAKELVDKSPDKYYYADQYANPENWKAHLKTTAPEIISQTKGSITHFVAGLGTTGTFTGTSKGLKLLAPDVRRVSLQPETALHGLEGWKHLETAKVPAIYDSGLADDNLFISTGEAYEMIRRVARLEGLLLSPSSAANLVGAIRVANSIKRGTVVTIFPDNADKYSEVLEQVLGTKKF